MIALCTLLVLECPEIDAPTRDCAWLFPAVTKISALGMEVGIE